MDYGEFIKFPFQDREWLKKMVLGCIILIIPIVNILALGYFVECIRLGMQGKNFRRNGPTGNLYVTGSDGLVGLLSTWVFLPYLP